MTTIGPTSPADLSEREVRLLNRLADKYGDGGSSDSIRGYIIAGLMISILYAVSRWIPWGLAAWFAAQILGLALFHQYRRFAGFKSRLLSRLWRMTASRTGRD